MDILKFYIVCSIMLGIISCQKPLLASDIINSKKLLQQGHSYKNEGNLDKAIEYYQKSLKSDSNNIAAQFSLDKTKRKKDIQSWARKYLPEECGLVFNNQVENVLFKCASEHLSIYGQPINPMIIKDLTTEISDVGDQVISINLLDSQDSNRYYCDSDFVRRDQYFYCENNDWSFGYRTIGKVKDDIHIIQTSYWGGGSGIFDSLLFIQIKKDKGINYDENNDRIIVNQERLLITKIGEISLGDSWNGKLYLEDDTVFVDNKKLFYTGK